MESLLWQESLKAPAALLGSEVGFSTNRTAACRDSIWNGDRNWTHHPSTSSGWTERQGQLWPVPRSCWACRSM